MIEKKVFLKALREWVEVDISGTSPYSALRLSVNPVSTAFRKGLPCIQVTDRAFYKGSYIPQGLQQTVLQLNGDIPEPAAATYQIQTSRNSGQHLRVGSISLYLKPQTQIYIPEALVAAQVKFAYRVLYISPSGAVPSASRGWQPGGPH